MREIDPGLIALGVYVVIFAVAWLIGAVRSARRSRRSTVHPVTSRLRARVRRMARPTLLFTPAGSPGFSRMGGLPELPAGQSWPGEEAEPAVFVAQIDVAEVRSHDAFDWLPEAGRLYVFFDEARNGAADCGALIYSTEPPAPPIAFPERLTKDRRFKQRHVGFKRSTSLPSHDWLGEEWADEDIDGEGFDPVADTDLGDEVEHRIGGYPSEIQGGQMGVQCEYLWRGLTQDHGQPVPDDIRHAARQWRLLLQIDSDPALGMNWWDGGRLYVFIRARDAKRGDFSKTVTLTQTY